MSAGAILIDDGPGERREVGLDTDGRPIWLSLHRESWRGARALWGDVYAARVTRVDKALRGAFLDLGLSQDEGYLRTDARGRSRLGQGVHQIVEGALLKVVVRSEATGEKGAVCALSGFDPARDGPGLIASRTDEFEPVAYDRAAREACDAALDEALARSVAIPGGGHLVIEPTEALTAIDVDAGARLGSADAAQFALALNLAAAEEVFRQARLRGLAGLAAIDFVSMGKPEARQTLQAELKRLAKAFPRQAGLAPANAFDVALVSFARLTAPLRALVCDAGGAKSAETVALAGLRALERAAHADRAAKLTLRAAPEVAAWLESGALDWRAALAHRAILRVELAADLAIDRERVEVEAS